MKRVSKRDILDIIKQIESEFEKDDIMSVYECFDFYEEDNDKIAKYLSNAINSKTNKDRLDNLVCVIAYCGSVVPDMILERLQIQKKLNKNKYNSLLKWCEDAGFLYKIKNTRFTTRDLEEYLEKSNHSIVKQEIKCFLDAVNKGCCKYYSK